ncbi:gamma-glutamyltransferase family protein [Aquicoccus sp. SCR17]|nr:gamma-glutamyltransferase family protein [Carideicomes alvinocaridis]
MELTRPEIRGTFGAVATTHWIASAVGMRMLERGGNAVDAAVAAGFVLQVVEPHLVGPGGDLPAILRTPDGAVRVLCAQGPAPAAATPDHFRDLGLDIVPGTGLLPGVVPGAFDGWLLLLRDSGTMELRDVLEPAIAYARDGHPLLPEAAATIARLAPHFAEHWPSSHATWCPGGRPPEPDATFRNPALADTYDRLAASAGDTREARIDAARQAWSRGFVAEGIGAYLEEAEVMDASGAPHRGLLTPDDMAGWSAHYEAPLQIEYRGWRISKTGPWGQGPVLLQALRILDHVKLDGLDPCGDAFVHVVIEAIKLAYADREAYYGDPDFSDIPMERLLSRDYGAERAALISDAASAELRPGRLAGYEGWADAAIARAAREPAALAEPDGGEPTMAHLTRREGDTVHLDVVDNQGNVVSATPSGGWLQSAPVVPGLGFPLNTRGQMFWLEGDGPSLLRPGSRPRTTLTPTIAEHEDGRVLSLGTPGGDQQDQWQLVWFLRMVHHGLDLQANMDAPLFHSLHVQASFYPRRIRPGEMLAEPGLGDETIAALRGRGHRVTVVPPASLGRMTAALRHPDGSVQAAATHRLGQAYAIGR